MFAICILTEYPLKKLLIHSANSLTISKKSNRKRTEQRFAANYFVINKVLIFDIFFLNHLFGIFCGTCLSKKVNFFFVCVWSSQFFFHVKIALQGQNKVWFMRKIVVESGLETTVFIFNLGLRFTK